MCRRMNDALQNTSHWSACLAALIYPGIREEQCKPLPGQHRYYNRRMSRTSHFHLAGCAICLAALAFGYFYLQRTLGFEPCPLCLLDRFVFAALAVIFALAYFQFPGKRDRIGYDIGAMVVSLGGTAIAGRHVYLQHYPPTGLGDCGAGFWYLLDQIGIEGTITSALQGRGDCSEIQWTLAGLSIPTLTLILFVVLFLLPLADMICAIRQHPRES